MVAPNNIDPNQWMQPSIRVDRVSCRRRHLGTCGTNLGEPLAPSAIVGGTAEFQLLDATVGEVSGRVHLSWRIRLRPAPFGIGDGRHVIEEQGYADTSELIESLDLLCPGFNAE
ncbi:hypothetical protein [Actinokineospora xionganensis]|uniref:Uncharacterized protein n=1 Tax=Actinokineospora xionganensis TaxID=2684470 RepID=A0ABR7LB39_9PSEU|nr:hypothetical protein [Actinokineospora xionganensis]MBC6449787.1 hypothetical protein [Actinokineospora xionganensis]